MRKQLFEIHLAFIFLVVTMLQSVTMGELIEERQLEFVHIPKTAGTAIEHAAAKAKIPWGACHFLTLSYCEEVADMPYENGNPWHVTATGKKVSNVWHMRPMGENARFLYEGKNTFTVVRNPYERAISAYYYEAKHKSNYVFNRASLNNYIMNELKNDWKYKPQSSYVYSKGEKVIDHVLHFETLDTEFEDLMKSYNLNITLPKNSVNGRVHGTKLDIRFLHKHAVNFLNEYYESDFSNFGYKKFTKGKGKLPRDLKP